MSALPLRGLAYPTLLLNAVSYRDTKRWITHLWKLNCRELRALAGAPVDKPSGKFIVPSGCGWWTRTAAIMPYTALLDWPYNGLVFLGVVCDLPFGPDKALDKGDQRKD